MTLRRTVFGVLTALVLSGGAAAKPPGEGGPLPEWRELDPVARDHYLTAPVPEAARDRTPTRPEQKPGDTVGTFIAALGEALLYRLSVPLGTARPVENG